MKMATFKTILLYGRIHVIDVLQWMGFIFSLRRFWMVYLCIVSLFLHGFLSFSMLDDTIIECDFPFYSFINDITYTTAIAILSLGIMLIYAVKAVRRKSYILSFFYLFYFMLIVFYAGKIAEFGDLILWLQRD